MHNFVPPGVSSVLVRSLLESAPTPCSGKATGFSDLYGECRACDGIDRRADSVRPHYRCDFRQARCDPTLAFWAGLGVFNILAFVLVARGADRLAHERRAAVLTESFERVITMPLAWHHERGTSHALHTLLRAVETLFGLWLEFMRQHLSTAVALLLLVPTAMSLDLRMSAVCFASASCMSRSAGW